MSTARALFSTTILAFGAAACSPTEPPRIPEALPPALPAVLQGKAQLLTAADPEYARADLANAAKPAGEGGLIQGRGMVVRVTADVPVWRLWSGPEKKDARGNTNRIGQWWSYDAPRGSQQGYRQSYEICVSWNDLTWVAKCTLKKGAVVAIGPGNSVSAATCGDAAGKEAYPANERDWQIWIAKAWTRLGTDKELDCPAEGVDYEADVADITRARPAVKRP
jgi:hypothetical protein